MNSPAVKTFIRKHSNLFWYIPEDKKEDISEDVLVEFILNYGTMDDVTELFRIMGIDKVAQVFFSASGRKKLNYYPEITLVYSSTSMHKEILSNNVKLTFYEYPFDIEAPLSLEHILRMPFNKDLNRYHQIEHFDPTPLYS